MLTSRRTEAPSMSGMLWSVWPTGTPNATGTPSTPQSDSLARIMAAVSGKFLSARVSVNEPTNIPL